MSAKPILPTLALALVAAGLGFGLSLWLYGPGPLLRTELGQRLFQNSLEAGAPAGVEILQPGDVPPDLVFDTHSPADGRRRLADWRGRPLLVNYWATWCAPCLHEMPLLDAFAAKQDVNGVQVVGIAQDVRDNLVRYLRRMPVRYELLYEAQDLPGGSAARFGNTRGLLPFTVLLDAEGRLRKRKYGAFAPGELENWTRLD